MEGKKIKGMPVISLKEGNLLGKVQEILFASEAKEIQGFLVGEKTFMKSSLKFLPFEHVYKIGSDAIITREEATLAEEPELTQSYPIAGQKVLSENGTAIGFVDDFSIEPKTGKMLILQLKDLELRDFKKEGLLNAEAIRSLGKDYIIAGEAFREHLHPLDKAYLRDRPLEMAKGLSHSLEIRAVEFSLGRDAAHTVEDDDGTAIIAKGEIVTEAVIDRARDAGKLYQVLFATGVGELLESIDYTRERLDYGSRRLLDAWDNFKERSQKFFHKEGDKEEEEAAGEETSAPGVQELSDLWERMEKELQDGTRKLSREVKENVKSYVLNKKAYYSVYDSEGNYIIREGEIITPSSLEEAEKGEKMAELLMAVASGEIKTSVNTLTESISKLFK